MEAAPGQTRANELGSGKPARRPASGKSEWLCLPREHGAWGMLLFPFVSGALLAGNMTPAILPALLAAVAVFVARAPIVILLRKRPEAPAARRTLWLAAAVLAVCGTWLLFVVPAAWLAFLGATGSLLVVVHVRAVIRGRQHAVPLQLAGAAGLTLSGALAYLSGGRQPDMILLLLWLAQTVHYTGSVLKIHAVIEGRKQKSVVTMDRPRKRGAAVWVGVQLAFAAAFCIGGFVLLGIALLIPCLLHGFDLLTIDDPRKRKTPLRTVGFRELGISAAFSALVVFGLW